MNQLKTHDIKMDVYETFMNAVRRIVYAYYTTFVTGNECYLKSKI